MGRPGSKPAGLFARLAGDVRANTLAIMAAAMIPLIGMVGGAVDLSRMYIVKTRLQHACDAGALAGRKAMGGGTWAQSDGYPGKAAAQFFDANISQTAYGAASVVGTFTENAGKVSGSATATVPMTLMRVFGYTNEVLTVTCDAEMRLPNTDVMFVLDVTGSMASRAISSDPDTKIDSLKTAVRCFYEIVARLDTKAQCTTGNPSGGTGNQVQIRFGFMPYSSNVNVGKLLPPSYFANDWIYPTREPEYWNQSDQTSSSETVTASFSRYECTNSNAAQYNSSSTSTNGATQSVTAITYSGANYRYSTCYLTKTTTTTTYRSTTTVSGRFSRWHYGQISVSLAGLKNGSSWNNSLTLPIGARAASRSIRWDGCIEERPTVRQTNYSPIPAGAYDMNIDLRPDSNDSNSLWGPALSDLIYMRRITSDYDQVNADDVYTTTDYYNEPIYSCPAEARKLQSWPSASAFDSYVDSLQPTGNTYHDVGITWGARFMSPTGLFTTENAFTPQGGEIERHMIFMTDGDATAYPCDYGSHGVAFYDKRTTTSVGTASDCARGNTALATQINNRFAALCTAVKNMNITLWVISFGSGSNTETETRLETCASSNRYFTARNSATLQTTFKSIADQISQLRLTK
jgi:Flp pilus assembly protein TadG